MDWSQALGKSFLDSFAAYGKTLDPMGNKLLPGDFVSWAKKCHAHFWRSMGRIADNGAIIPPKRRGEFHNLMCELVKTTNTFHEFRRIARKVQNLNLVSLLFLELDQSFLGPSGASKAWPQTLAHWILFWFCFVHLIGAACCSLPTPS